jgi:hypothetical protein
VRNLAAAATELLEWAAAAPAGRAALTLIPQRGRVGLVVGSGHWSWARVITSRSAHAAPAEKPGGRCRPLDRSRETIKLRETLGNLSGSGLETHQHFYPTGANCCYSMLLDPRSYYRQ